ncbi:MAG: hypothetical protein L3J72_01230, partial [Thermoplasmata archaeon]|nr:hypothetical protein [Thermoplasmata archaeon]
MSIVGYFQGARGRKHLVLVVGAVAAVVVVLLAVVSLYNHSSSASVTVSGASAYLEEGRTTQGQPWFGVANVSFVSGYPLTLPVGGTFTVSLNLANDDSLAHSLVAFNPNAPFHVVSSSPPAPVLYAAHGDGDTTITVQAPGAAGSYVL